jgi:hypothetical protein
MFGSEEILAFIRRSVGVRGDAANANGSLHSKAKYNALMPFTRYSFGGNGSLGDVVVSTNTTISGINHYNSLTVNYGVALTCGTGTMIFVKETLTVNGLITSSGQGGAGGASYGGSGGQGGGLAGSGGAGGSYTYDSNNKYMAGSGGSTDFSGGIAQLYYNGASGIGTVYQGWGIEKFAYAKGGGGGGGGYTGAGAGGAGGGSLLIEAMNVIIGSTGAIRADGLNGGNGSMSGSGGGGGGGGGILVINCSTLSNSGAISAVGGAGGTGSGASGGWYGYNGGNGGTGIVAIISR